MKSLSLVRPEWSNGDRQILDHKIWSGSLNELRSTNPAADRQLLKFLLIFLKFYQL